MTTFRIASSVRRQVSGQPGVWEDAETSFYDVATYKALATNVGASAAQGPARSRVHGRQHVRSWQKDDGTTWWAVEVVADAVGHDLAFGTAAFSKVGRGQGADGDGLGRSATRDGSSGRRGRDAEGGRSAAPRDRPLRRRGRARPRARRGRRRPHGPATTASRATASTDGCRHRSARPDGRRGGAAVSDAVGGARIRAGAGRVDSLAPCPSSSTSCRVPARRTATRSSSTTSPCPSCPAPRSASSAPTARGSPRS